VLLCGNHGCVLIASAYLAQVEENIMSVHHHK